MCVRLMPLMRRESDLMQGVFSNHKARSRKTAGFVD